MSTLFYEPSTRTRLSFEGAMGRGLLSPHLTPDTGAFSNARAALLVFRSPTSSALRRRE